MTIAPNPKGPPLRFVQFSEDTMAYEFPVFYSDLFLTHDTGAGHPENATRLVAVVDYLKASQRKHGESELNLPMASGSRNDDLAKKKDDWVNRIVWREPSSRSVLPDVHRVHDSGYVAALKAFAEKGGGYLDADTLASPQSYEVALLAVAAWLDGVDVVIAQQSPAFALVRPPGHHAERDHSMGFCLLSNAAIAAHYALASGVERVAILDWDVHHGNGTQALIEENPNLAYCSFHQSPAYPGTGTATERGRYQNVLNLPVPPGSVLADYQTLWEEQAQTFLSDFLASAKSSLLIVSAGYDANQADPLAGVSLHPEDYGWFTQQCMELTPAVLFGLEGGYDFTALAESVAATIRVAIEAMDKS